MAYKNMNRNKDKWPWMGQRFVEGKKQRKCFLTKKDAQLWEMEKNTPENILSNLTERETPSVSLGQWANEYLKYSKETFVEKTFQEKVLAMKMFFSSPSVSPSMTVESLTPYLAQQSLQKQSSSRSGNAANRDKKNLSAAWSWGVKYFDLPEKNPFAEVGKFASIRHNRHVPTLDDFWSVFNHVKKDQDKLMLYCYLQTGARRDELFRLLWSDVDFFGKRIQLKCRKNRAGEWKNQWISVKDDLIQWLIIHHKAHNPALGNNVFPHMRLGRAAYVARQKWLRRLCLEIGIIPFNYHGIRHLFASILAANNIPIVEIQRMLRHSSIRTTEKYIHCLRTENREVLEVLPGLEKSTSKVHQTDSSALMTGH